MKIIAVVGARPNFMKIMPLIDEFSKINNLDVYLIHTGQHYNTEMSKIFFEDLKIRKPDIYFGVGSGSHAEQTAEIMIKFEKIALREKPDLVLVVGDVNSTLACSITASKLNIPVAHVEAGLRSFDMTMPEEINRVVTDLLSSYLFTTCKDGNINLIKEGIPENKVFFVGNVMIDTLLKFKEIATESTILKKLNLKRKKYAVLTLHRPENVDRYCNLETILKTMEQIQKQIKIVFPVHLRTRKMIKKFGLENWIDKINNLVTIPPLGYIDFLWLLLNSNFVMTDSGGIQEETTVLDIPCLTLRKTTERPVTALEGTNIVVGLNQNKINHEVIKILKNKRKKGKIPELWDGKAAKRIVDILINKLS